jgi:hypothetical protein
MTQDVRKYRDEMGQTGAGIMHEEEINMELKNTFTNRWGMSLTAIAKSQMGIA